MKKLVVVASLALFGSIGLTLAACARSEASATGSASAAARAPATTVRVSVSSAGQQGDRDSFAVGISADGRYVLITSQATNLVPGDTNLTPDVFVNDRRTGQTTRVSVSSDGEQGTPPANGFGGSSAEGISADGRYVVFRSIASNLVPGDTNGAEDIFIHDRQTAQTTRVSVGSGARQANASSTSAAMSADGRYVAFTSAASNLVPGDTNHALDIFVYDRKTDRTTRVSINSNGKQANGWSEGQAISAHGRFVAFTSIASNLVAGDSNHLPDVFVRDRVTGKTERISVSSSGRQATGSATNNGSNAPSISAYGGRYVVFHSDASSLVAGDTNRTEDIFVHDRWTGHTTRVSVSSSGKQANAESLAPAGISPYGRYVAFASLASNLVARDTNDITDVFVHDLRTGQTLLASLGGGGVQGMDGSALGQGSVFSVGSRYLAFSSASSNLVAGDTNVVPDAFVRDFGGPPTVVK